MVYVAFALLAPQKAVRYTARIYVESRDRPRRIVGNGEGALATGGTRAWSIERGDGAVTCAHEAVTHSASVHVGSYDRPRWVDVLGLGALGKAPRSRAWSIERSDGAVRRAQVAVNHTSRVPEEPRDR